ncbi:thiosulfate oxidation carrier protein SoxY [Bradyrhizobium sp. 41S5]|uniref:thiosulfate oxidation carrier protein SoxY n=1 Tax=Bradyrhizobium sp. 41S5 TaxID=1404443 RepID=UPI00156AC603|nr:thiosulfate oxidation carrier protein SoxY [Bradyrhizobium sp. 41S5]UFX43961.1 thiosulfate oxidation carrier protein SoxY [Bradyrhizobium sp. 41S5]
MDVTSTDHSRRELLRLAALAGLALVVTSGRAEATADEVSAAIAKLYGDKKLESGKVKLDVPEIAENGLVVPITVEVESPMTDADYVKAVHIFADGNPLPNVVSYKFTPACGKAAASTRMRLAQTQNVICIAEMSNGNLHRTSAAIKVTIGGCGG